MGGWVVVVVVVVGGQDPQVLEGWWGCLSCLLLSGNFVFVFASLETVPCAYSALHTWLQFCASEMHGFKLGDIVFITLLVLAPGGCFT